MAEDRKTPLFEAHVAQGGKIVSFAGWKMPVEFKGLRQEHHQVRQSVGLFDVSHMGEIRLQGDKALESVEWLTTNHVAKLKAGEAQYTLLSHDGGGVVDDLIVYCLEPGVDYLLCVNAANKDKDLQWILDHNKGADVIDESDVWAQIAIQGPNAVELTKRVLGDAVADVASFCFSKVDYKGSGCLVARTGYTGEDGFEVFVPVPVAVELWNQLLNDGKDFGAQPIGLGARDTLRTEVKFPLYGNELDESTNPYEAGLGWVVKPDKKDFVGKDKMLEAKKNGLKRKLVGLEMIDRGIPRHGYRLFSFDNQEIGTVTSGTVSPTLDQPIGIAYVNKAFADEGAEILVEVRQRKLKARVVKTPFVRK